MSNQEHLDVAVKILEDIPSEWDTGFDGGITPETRLVDDLGLRATLP